MRLLLLALVLAACAPYTPPNPNGKVTVAADGSKMICRQETETGSSISHEVCRTPEQMEREKKSADDFMLTPSARPLKN